MQSTDKAWREFCEAMGTESPERTYDEFVDIVSDADISRRMSDMPRDRGVALLNLLFGTDGEPCWAMCQPGTPTQEQWERYMADAEASEA